jgi:hypothetical protein
MEDGDLYGDEGDDIVTGLAGDEDMVSGEGVVTSVTGDGNNNLDTDGFRRVFFSDAVLSSVITSACQIYSRIFAPTKMEIVALHGDVYANECNRCTTV